MLDCDALIIGGGPAGLTAGLYLSRGGFRTLILEGELYGGKIVNLECIENYPGYADGVSGAQLTSEMVSQAVKYGLKLEQGKVEKIDFYSKLKCVTCDNGKSYTTSAVIIAGGSHQKKLGVPGEEALYGKGVFTCALCDGGQYTDQTVVVRGGGDAGVTEALYMTNMAAKVIIIASHPELSACAVLRERALSNPKIEIRCGTEIEAIIGTNQVEAVQTVEIASGNKEILKAEGVLVHIGLVANTAYLPDNIPLDPNGQVVVNARMETEIPLVFAAGDIRSGSPGQVSTAVGDGATAAISAIRQLQQIG